MNENDVIESEAVTDEPQDNEPSSMLEAIEQGLGQADEPADEEAEEEIKAEEVNHEQVAQEPAHEDDETPPEGISKKAQERFQRLVGKVKEKDEELLRVRSDIENFRKVMKDTGGTPEDFSATFDYIRALRQGDYQTARTMLEDQIRQLSVMTGQHIGQVDPLAQFPDLRERVNAYQMDEQTALEMARHRMQQNAQQEAVSRYQMQQQQTQAFQHSRQSAMMEVDRLGSEWAKRDPDYAIKEDIILKQIPQIAQNFPPNQWARQVEILYNTLGSVPLQRQVQQTPPPLRSSGQSAGKQQPKDLMDALNMGLGYGN